MQTKTTAARQRVGTPEQRYGDAMIAAGIKPLSPWEFLQNSGVVVDLAWAELLSAKTGCSVQFWLNMQEGYENGKG